MLEVFGKDRGLHSLMSGFFTQIQTLIEISHLSKSIHQHENEKKRKYATRVLEIEQGTFTPLVFSTTGGMGEECQRFHSRLAELLASKKGDDYSTTISWIRCKVSFAVLRTALLCLRGSRTLKRVKANLIDTDFDLENWRYA